MLYQFSIYTYRKRRDGEGVIKEVAHTGTKNKLNSTILAVLFPSIPHAVMVSRAQFTRQPVTIHVSKAVGWDMLMSRRDSVDRDVGVGWGSIVKVVGGVAWRKERRDGSEVCCAALRWEYNMMGERLWLVLFGEPGFVRGGKFSLRGLFVVCVCLCGHALLVVYADSVPQTSFEGDAGNGLRRDSGFFGYE
jgi:hypothetical protein